MRRRVKPREHVEVWFRTTTPNVWTAPDGRTRTREQLEQARRENPDAVWIVDRWEREANRCKE